VQSKGTFRETWELRWEPEFAVRVIEASRWGTTVQAAAEAKILDTAARSGSGVTELTEALEFALLAELPGALDGLIARLGSAAAVDHDMTHLLAALPGLLRTLRYGDVRGTDTSALTHVADSMLVRICAGLPAAVTGLGDDTAAALRDQLDTATTAVHTRNHAESTEQWLSVLARLADRPDVHGLLVGRTVRLLCDADRIDTEEAARRLAAALSVGNTAAAKAAWVDGFVGGCDSSTAGSPVCPRSSSSRSYRSCAGPSAPSNPGSAARSAKPCATAARPRPLPGPPKPTRPAACSPCAPSPTSWESPHEHHRTARCHRRGPAAPLAPRPRRGRRAGARRPRHRRRQGHRQSPRRGLRQR
jgi:hypothetical protein